MSCGICGENKTKRTISGIPMCEDCFTKLTLLRKDDIKTIAFFKDDSNLLHASKEGKEYIYLILQEKQDLINSVKEKQQHLIEEQQRIAALKQRELDKINYAKSFKEYYEYDVVTIENKSTGEVKIDKLKSILTEYSSKGWKLHSIYSNELGKNALLGLNATASEDVLIFERRIEKI